MHRSLCIWSAVSLFLVSAVVAQQPQGKEREPKIDQPLTAGERSATAKLTRLHSVRLWWNTENRITGIGLKDTDANDHTVALAGMLPGLRAVVLLPTPHSHLTDRGLASLAALPELETLGIYGNRTTDAAMVYVGRMRKLQTLVLNCNITDAGLAALTQLTNIEKLDLSQTKITDAGIVHVKSFAKLRTLTLNGTRVTNDSLSTIVDLKTVQRLYLGNTAIDDGAVAFLKQMEQLQLLFLLDTQVTDQGVAELQSALPESCTIVHQSGSCTGTRKSQLAMAGVSTQPTTWRPAK